MRSFRHALEALAVGRGRRGFLSAEIADNRDKQSPVVGARAYPPVVPRHAVRRERLAAMIAGVTKRTALGPSSAVPTARHSRVECGIRPDFGSVEFDLYRTVKIDPQRCLLHPLGTPINHGFALFNSLLLFMKKLNRISNFVIYQGNVRSRIPCRVGSTRGGFAFLLKFFRASGYMV